VGEPTTEAGKALLDLPTHYRNISRKRLIAAVLAIEAEAREDERAKSMAWERVRIASMPIRAELAEAERQIAVLREALMGLTLEQGKATPAFHEANRVLSDTNQAGRKP
jgi:hypothetical protein